MRPVVRGPWPQDSLNRERRDFKHYSEARGELIARLGEYCSYCEMHLDSGLAVEHVLPKKPPGASSNDLARELDWHNFLLACPNCNSTKDNKVIVWFDYLWPDRENTFRAFKYSSGGMVKPADHLIGLALDRAEETIRLTGLHKQPLNDPCVSDRRWQNRREAWDMANDSKADLATNDTPQMRNQIIRTAKANGYWSIWMTVFTDDVIMRKALIEAFPGTSSACFDANGQTLRRPGGLWQI